jgi:hypothetical protein
MKKLCLISIIFWLILVIFGCGEISNVRSIEIPVEIDVSFDAKKEIAKKVVEEVSIDLNERLLSRFPNVSNERLNSLNFGWGTSYQIGKRTVFVAIEINWKGEFKEPAGR